MAKKYTTGIIITGDPKGGIKAVSLTDKSLNNLSKTGKRTSTQLADMSKRAAGWAAIAGGAATAATVVMVKRQLDLIDATAKTADVLGIQTEKLVALRLQAELTGVSQGVLDKGIRQMTRTIADAANGIGEGVDSLASLGLEAEKLSKMSPDEQFYAISKALEGVEDQSQKVAIAYDLFGGRATSLLNTLDAGVESFRKSEQFTERWGLALNRIDSNKVEQANDAMTLASRASEGFWKQLTVQVSPAITGVATDLLEMGEEAGDAGDLAERSFTTITDFAGLAADSVRLLHISLVGASAAMMELAAQIASPTASADSWITDLSNSIVDAIPEDSKDWINEAFEGYFNIHTEQEYASVQEAAKASRAIADEMTNRARELLEAELPSDVLKRKLKEYAEEAEKQAALAGKKKPVGEIAETSTESLDAMERQFELIRDGMTVQAAANAVARETEQRKLEDAKLTSVQIERYFAAKDAIEAKTEAEKETADVQKDLQKFLETSIDSKAFEAFDQMGKSMFGVVDALDELAERQQAYNELTNSGALSTEELTKASKQQAKNQIAAYADITGAAKGFFSEGSKGYAALEKAEVAFRAVQMAQSIASTAQLIISAQATAAAEGSAQVASSGKGLPFPLNIAAMVATIGFLSSIGVGARGGGSSSAGYVAPVAEKLDYVTAGSMVDPSEQAEGIENSLDIIASLSREQIPYLAQMSRSLQNLEGATTAATTAFVRGNYGSGSLNLNGDRVWDAVMGRLGGTYTGADTIEYKKAVDYFLSEMQRLGGLYGGFGSSKSTDQTFAYNRDLFDQYTALYNEAAARDAAINAENGTFARSIEQGIIDAAELMRDSLNNLGILSGDINSAILPVLNIDASEGRDAVKEKIGVFFDDVFDRMLQAGAPMLSELQRLGEGAIEAVTRIAAQTSVYKDFAASFGSLTANNSYYIDVADDLSQMAGGLEKFSQNLQSTLDLLLSDTEKLNKTEDAVSALFSAFGRDVPESLSDLRELMENFPDAGTEFGAEFFTAITESTDLLRQYYEKQEEQRENLFDLENRLLALQGRDAEALLRVREAELEAATDAESALLRSIFALEDQKEALEAQRRASEDATRALERFASVAQSIRGYLDELSRNGGTPEANQASALDQFRSTAAMALGGDVEAAAGLQRLAQDVITLSQSAFASGAQYQTAFSEVVATLERVAGAVDSFTADQFLTPQATASSLGNIFSSGNVIPFAKGGAFTNTVATKPTMAPMALFGEAGPEAILPLMRAANGSLGVRGQPVNITPVVEAIHQHRGETEHQTRIQAAANKQVIRQLQTLNVKVRDLEDEQKQARLARG